MRFREASKLKELRGPVNAGMDLLIHAYEHLQKQPPTPENAAAMELILPIIGTLENENKELADKSAELWGEVLDLDGVELSSPEILEALERTGRGQCCIERAMHHLEKRFPVGELAFPGRSGAAGQLRLRGKGNADDEEALRTLTDLHWQLVRLRADLENAQEKYQWAMAKALTSSPEFGPPTKPV